MTLHKPSDKCLSCDAVRLTGRISDADLTDKDFLFAHNQVRTKTGIPLEEAVKSSLVGLAQRMWSYLEHPPYVSDAGRALVLEAHMRGKKDSLVEFMSFLIKRELK